LLEKIYLSLPTPPLPEGLCNPFVEICFQKPSIFAKFTNPGARECLRIFYVPSSPGGCLANLAGHSYK